MVGRREGKSNRVVELVMELIIEPALDLSVGAAAGDEKTPKWSSRPIVQHLAEILPRHSSGPDARRWRRIVRPGASEYFCAHSSILVASTIIGGMDRVTRQWH